MEVDPLMLLIGKIGVVFGFCGLVQWMIAYSIQDKWWRHQLGWTLVGKTAVIACLLFISMLSLFFHIQNETTAWLETLFLLMVGPIMVWRTLVWSKEARNAKRLKRIERRLTELKAIREPDEEKET